MIKLPKSIEFTAEDFLADCLSDNGCDRAEGCSRTANAKISAIFDQQNRALRTAIEALVCKLECPSVTGYCCRICEALKRIETILCNEEKADRREIFKTYSQITDDLAEEYCDRLALLDNALDYSKKTIKLLQAMAGTTPIEDACRNIIAHGNLALDGIQKILESNEGK